MMEDSLNEDVQPRTVTYVRQEVLQRTELTTVSELTDHNMVTIDIKRIRITNIYNTE